MTPAKVVKRDVKSNCGFVIVQRLAESVRQSCQSAKVHPHTQVGAFDMRSRNGAPIRSADFDVWDRSQHLPRAIPVIGADSSVDLVKLAKFHISTKVLSHRAHVSVVLIGRNLIAAIGSFAKIVDEGMGADSVASADVITDEQLCFGVNCQPQHCAAPFVRIIVPKMRIACVYESPHFVKLHVTVIEIFHQLQGDFAVQIQFLNFSPFSLAIFSIARRNDCVCFAFRILSFAWAVNLSRSTLELKIGLS